MSVALTHETFVQTARVHVDSLPLGSGTYDAGGLVGIAEQLEQRAAGFRIAAAKLDAMLHDLPAGWELYAFTASLSSSDARYIDLELSLRPVAQQ